MNNYNRILAVMAVSILGIGAISAQDSKGVGIGTANPDPSAVLDIVPASDNQGLGLPQATPAAINTNVAPAKPKEGLMTYDKDTKEAYYYNGAEWIPIGVPKGTIVMWSGSTTDIPRGWALCDGRAYNPNDYYGDNGFLFLPSRTAALPNLRGKFILGNSSDPGGSIGSTGGTKTETLTSSQVPNHSHTLSGNGRHNHTGSTDNGEGTHDHGIRVNPPSGTGNGDRNNISGTKKGNDPAVKTGRVSAGEHRHRFTTNNTNHTHTVVSTTGGGQPHNNMPPYYVLAYIMKI